MSLAVEVDATGPPPVAPEATCLKWQVPPSMCQGGEWGKVIKRNKCRHSSSFSPDGGDCVEMVKICLYAMIINERQKSIVVLQPSP